MAEKTLVGVIGAGSFGTAVANLLAEKKRVLIYTRNDKLANAMRQGERYNGWIMHPDIIPTNSLEEVSEKCTLIFPVIPSAGFREMMRSFAPFLRPDHILIHGTKGLDVILPEGKTLETVETLSRANIKTMSEVIQEESVVRRIGSISGPNLSKEILAGFPAATVVASRFKEVIDDGKEALRTPMFRVHGNSDLLGVELAGVLKNIMAIASGILTGLGYGDNTRGMLMARGMAEIARMGTALGAAPRTFLGMAGIGDLVATCSSPLSRNHTVGFRLAKGEKLADILADMTEVAEGVKTTLIAKKLSDYYHLPSPITRAIYRALFEDLEVKKGVRILMEYPFTEDVDFI